MPSRTPSSRGHRFTGSLYQLYSRGPLSSGAYVEVNGPHDTFGVVLKSETDAKDADGRFLNLIRGIPPRILDKPVASF